MTTANPSDSDDNHHDQYWDRLSFLLLDSDIVNSRNIEQKFHSITNKFKRFQDVQSCLEHIEKMSDEERIVLIVTGILGRELIPSIHEFQHVISIYVYCWDKKAHLDWSSQFTKVKYFNQIIFFMTSYLIGEGCYNRY